METAAHKIHGAKRDSMFTGYVVTRAELFLGEHKKYIYLPCNDFRKRRLCRSSNPYWCSTMTSLSHVINTSLGKWNLYMFTALNWASCECMVVWCCISLNCNATQMQNTTTRCSWHLFGVYCHLILRTVYSTFRHVTVYPKKYAHGFVVLCFVVVMQSFKMNSHEVFIHIHQGCFAGTGAIVRLPQCQWSKPDGYGKISQCITTTKHSKAKTVCIFLVIYCRLQYRQRNRAINHTYKII